MPRRTSLMSAPTHSQIRAISLMKLILVESIALAAYLVISALSGDIDNSGLSVRRVGLIQIGQHVDHLLPPRADHHPVGLHEIVDRHPLLEKLGIAGHIDLSAGDLLEPGGEFRIGSHRHRALANDDALGPDVRADLLDGRPESRKIDRLVGGRGRSHRRETAAAPFFAAAARSVVNRSRPSATFRVTNSASPGS